MRVAFSTDTTNDVTDAVVETLERLGHEVVSPGPGGTATVAWPVAGRGVGQLVAEGAADLGIVCCWTGTGVSIAANKVPGVRAALCTSSEIAVGARRWNDANVLALGVGYTSAGVAAAIVEAFVDPVVEVDAEEIANIAAVTDG